MIVDLMHILETEGGGICMSRNIWANTLSPLLPQSSVQKGGIYFWELMVLFVLVRS